jgi:hypothetical protein
MFAELDQLVAEGKSTLFQTSANDIQIVDINGERLFYKLARVSSMPVSKIINLSVNKYKHSFAPLNYRSADQSKSFEKEKRTIHKWHLAGINCIRPVESSDTRIVFPFVNLPSVQTLLNQYDDMSLFRKTVDSYLSIREAAFQNDDPDMLHSDCHLDNFLFSEEDDYVIPIDPGFCTSRKLSTTQLDAHLNLYFMYSFFRLDDAAFAEELARDFSTNLSPRNKRDMLSVHTPISPIAQGYLFLKEIALPYVSGSSPQSGNSFKTYSPKNHALIEKLLK